MATNLNQSKSKPRKLRGWATYKGEGEFAFRPCEEGEPTQLNVRTTTGGKVFNTTSAKKPLQVAHLSCAADAADPWQEYTSQLKKLGIKPQEPQKQPTTERIVAEGNLQCWLDEKTQELMVQSILGLSTHFRNWQAELLRQVQLIVRRLPANENFNKVINNLKKGGKQ